MSSQELLDRLNAFQIFFAFAMYVFNTRKRKDLEPGDVFAGALAWYLWPLLMIFIIIYMYTQRRRLRWLQKYWFLCGANECMRFLTNTKKQKRK